MGLSLGASAVGAPLCPSSLLRRARPSRPSPDHALPVRLARPCFFYCFCCCCWCCCCCCCGSSSGDMDIGLEPRDASSASSASGRRPLSPSDSPSPEALSSRGEFNPDRLSTAGGRGGASAS